MKPFIDLGTRNKPTLWEYGSAYSFLHTKLPITKYQVPTFLAFGSGEPNKHCHHIDVINDSKKLLIKEFNEGKYTAKFFQNLDAVYREKLEETKQICKKNHSEDSNQELSKKFDQTTKNIFETVKPMVLALKSQYLSEFFKQELTNVLNQENNILEKASLLLTPTKLTQIQKEEEKIVQLLHGFEKGLFKDFINQEETKNKLKEIAKNYGWFHMEYIQNPWDYKDYETYLLKRFEQNTNKAELPTKKIEKIKLKQENFFKTHSCSDLLKKLTIVLKEFSLILDYSKAVFIEGIYITRPLFSEIANRLGLSCQQLLYLTPPEITNLLEKEEKAEINLVNQRKALRVVLLENNIIKVYEGKKAALIGIELVQEQETTDTNEFKGIIAYQGKFKGYVKIINSIRDKDKFKMGDILVTHDGTAELTLFLKQAGAIVTNQGGMICHAAIIAREQKTPCIVGTKIATKVLKNGDLIEVDANKGIIKKLN